MVLVYFTDRDDDFARLDIELAAPESFVQPELFQGDFSASFHLCLVLSAFVGIDFDCRFGSPMFKLDFHSHGPTLSEVVSEVQGYVREVESAM